MANSLAGPQPGDGTWLLLNRGSNNRAAAGKQKRRRGQHQKEDSPMRTADDEDGEDVVIGSKNHNSIEKDDDAQRVEAPRTIAAQTSTFAPANTHIDAVQQEGAVAADGSNYTSQAPLDMENTSRPSMRPLKPLAPHLRKKKVALSAENTISTADASAPGQNGAPRSSAPSSDWAKPRNAPRGRGNGNGRGDKGGGSSFAAARAEIPKPDRNRYKTDWNPRKSWDSSSFDSERLSSGWGTKKKKRAGQTASPPPADWDGKLAPPPPDWDSRPGFRAEQSYSKIMDWMSEIEHQLCAIPVHELSLDNVTGTDGTTYVFCLSSLQPDTPSNDLSIRQMGEVVPQYWMPIVIGRQAPQTFWMELVASKSPMPDDPIDLEGAKPWWERFVKGGNGFLNFLKDPPVPEVVGIDPDQEDADQKLKRKHDQGSASHAENRRRCELELQQATVVKQKRIAEKRRKQAAIETTSNALTNLNRIKPGYKVFVRAAKAEDMNAVKDIYNYYVENSTAVPQMERRSKEEMVERYQNVRLQRMPFLVAYKPGVVIKAPRPRKGQAQQLREDVTLPDTIIGFAFADDYMDSRGMYRFTAELKFYTRDTEYMNGVASCLLDKLMGLLDESYPERGGYEATGDDIDGLTAIRIIKNIVISMTYDKPEKLQWVSKWLGGWMKFREVGVLENIGTKNGVAVNMAIFQRETGVKLDHTDPPSGFVPS